MTKVSISELSKHSWASFGLSTIGSDILKDVLSNTGISVL